MNKSVENTEALSEKDSWTLKDAMLAVGAFAIIAALAIGAFFFYQSTKPPLVSEGTVAPDFDFPTLAGGNAKLSDYRGKVVMLNLWNTTCLQCKEEMPLMQEKYEQWKQAGLPVEILAVSTDGRGAVDVQPWVDNLFNRQNRKVKLTFPILLDTENLVGSTYQTVRYPETFIVDEEGVVRRIIIGRLTDEQFILIESMMGVNPQASGASAFHTQTTTN